MDLFARPRTRGNSGAWLQRQAHRTPDNLRIKEELEEIWPRIRVFLPLLLVVHVSAPPPIPQLKVPSALQMMRGR